MEIISDKLIMVPHKLRNIEINSVYTLAFSGLQLKTKNLLESLYLTNTFEKLKYILYKPKNHLRFILLSKFEHFCNASFINPVSGTGKEGLKLWDAERVSEI